MITMQKMKILPQATPRRILSVPGAEECLPEVDPATCAKIERARSSNFKFGRWLQVHASTEEQARGAAQIVTTTSSMQDITQQVAQAVGIGVR